MKSEKKSLNENVRKNKLLYHAENALMKLNELRTAKGLKALKMIPNLSTKKISGMISLYKEQTNEINHN